MEAEPGFKIIQRDIEMPGFIIGLINIFKPGAHVYFLYNDAPASGRWTWGFNGGTKGSMGRPDKTNEGRVSRRCNRTEAILQHGKGKGKSGMQATDQEIKDCIEKAPATQTYHYENYNCGDWLEEAIKACGLKCS